MQAQIDRFSRVAFHRVLPDRRCQAVCGGQLLASSPKTGASARAHRNPVPSCDYTHGRAGWREGY
jgi:hypothetical protein